MRISSDIEKRIRNIIRLSVMLLLLAAVWWFYEPLVQVPMPEKMAACLLTFSLILPTSIIINAKMIRKQWQNMHT